MLTWPLKAWRLAPGSLLGSLQRTYCQDTRFSQASKLEKGNNIIVCSPEKASRPVIVYLGCPSTPDVFTVHDIRHALPISAGKVSSRASSGW